MGGHCHPEFLRSFLNLLRLLLIFLCFGFGPRGTWDLNSLTRSWTSCTGRWSLSHWTTREARLPPTQSFYFSYHQVPELLWISGVSIASEQCEGFFGAKNEGSRLNILIGYFFKFLIIYWHDSKIKIVLKCLHWEVLCHLCYARL